MKQDFGANALGFEMVSLTLVAGQHDIWQDAESAPQIPDYLAGQNSPEGSWQVPRLTWLASSRFTCLLIPSSCHLLPSRIVSKPSTLSSWFYQKSLQVPISISLIIAMIPHPTTLAILAMIIPADSLLGTSGQPKEANWCLQTAPHNSGDERRAIIAILFGKDWALGTSGNFWGQTLSSPACEDIVDVGNAHFYVLLICFTILNNAIFYV